MTSGDTLRVDEIRVNCEMNSLVFLVTPQGQGACHAKRADGRAHTSCYYRKINSDDSLSWIEE
jgi:phosphoribosyl-AMP cyclohydrolase